MKSRKSTENLRQNKMLIGLLSAKPKLFVWHQFHQFNRQASFSPSLLRIVSIFHWLYLSPLMICSVFLFQILSCCGPYGVTPMMKNMCTVGVLLLVHGAHHTLLISNHWCWAHSPHHLWVCHWTPDQVDVGSMVRNRLMSLLILRLGRS